MVGKEEEAQVNFVNGLRVKQATKAPLNALAFLAECQTRGLYSSASRAMRSDPLEILEALTFVTVAVIVTVKTERGYHGQAKDYSRACLDC